MIDFTDQNGIPCTIPEFRMDYLPADCPHWITFEKLSLNLSIIKETRLEKVFREN